MNFIKRLLEQTFTKYWPFLLFGGWTTWATGSLTAGKFMDNSFGCVDSPIHNRLWTSYGEKNGEKK